MPIPTVYTPIQPSPSIVMKPIVWVDNVWTAITGPSPCGPPGPPLSPGPPQIYGEVFTVTVPSFTPVMTSGAYFGDPGLRIDLFSNNGVSGSATLGTGVATATCTGPGGIIRMKVSGNYTEYLFPNKEYKYRSDAVLPTHLPTPVVSPSGYTAQYGTLNQGSALIRSPYLNPIGGSLTAGQPGTGLIDEITVKDHMQAYTPDPNYMIIVEFTVVIDSSCTGITTFPIKQIVYDDKDIASTRFGTAINSQTGRVINNLKTIPKFP